MLYSNLGGACFRRFIILFFFFWFWLVFLVYFLIHLLHEVFIRFCNRISNCFNFNYNEPNESNWSDINKSICVNKYVLCNALGETNKTMRRQKRQFIDIYWLGTIWKYDGNGMSVHLIHIVDGISIFELKIAWERKLGMFTGSSKERVWRIGSTNILKKQ